MQAPQSQVLSAVHARAAQLCRPVEPALQSVFTGHLTAPPTHFVRSRSYCWVRTEAMLARRPFP